MLNPQMNTLLRPVVSDLNRLEEFLEEASGVYASNTEIGYSSDFTVFARWCMERDLCALPAEDKTVAAFIDDQATMKKPSTIERYLSAICFFHLHLGYGSPRKRTKTAFALKRAKRRNRGPQRQAKPLRETDVMAMVKHAPDTLKGVRDVALVTVGYDSMLRREELTRFTVEDVIPDPNGGAIVTLEHSKCDQYGSGEEVYLRPGTYRYLKAWLDRAEITSGPVFRALRRGVEGSKPLRPADVPIVFRKLTENAGLSAEGVSGHSLRVGAAVDLAWSGASLTQIMKRGRWQTEEMVMRYIRGILASQVGRATTTRDDWCEAS